MVEQNDFQKCFFYSYILNQVRGQVV